MVTRLALLARPRWLAGLLAIVLAGTAARWWWERESVGYLFDLKTVPWSVSSASCESQGFTDTLFTCAFEIAPEDFPKLMASSIEKYQLRETPNWKHSHDHPMANGMGPNFEVGWHFAAVPKDAPHGGSIDVLADKEKRHVLAHLYIE